MGERPVPILETSPSHPWWWDSNNSPKHSTWLQSQMSGVKEIAAANGSQAPVTTAGAHLEIVEGQREGAILEDREEGELEEGEIELPDQSSNGSPLGKSGAPDRHLLDRSETRERFTGATMKGVGRGVDRSDSGYYSRERASRQFHTDYSKHQYLREVDFERESSRERWDREKHRHVREMDLDRERLEKEKNDDKKLIFERNNVIHDSTQITAANGLQSPVTTDGAHLEILEGQHEGAILEDREEGELEEGEIELPEQSSRGSPSGKSVAPDRLLSDRSETRERLTGARLKGVGRGGDRSDSGYYSRERASRQFHADYSKHQYLREVDLERESSRERWDREKHRHVREMDLDRERLEKEKLDDKKLTFERKDILSMTSKLVKNVTVKDAQKSFSSVCKRLCKALKLLDELSSSQDDSLTDGGSGRLPSDVSGLARQAFSGIRSVFTIWNTASGREQERDKELFPRLLELATGLCPKLFKKESRELEGMRQTVAKAGRGLASQCTSTTAGGEKEDPGPPGEAKEESPGNSTSATTQVENFMSRLSTDTESTAETATRGARDGLADAKQAADAAAIAAAAIAYAQSSAAGRGGPHLDSRYLSSVSQVPGVRMDPWPWPAGNPLNNQLPTSRMGGLLIPTARPILHSASSGRALPPLMPRYKPWTEPDRHELETNNIWPGQTKLKPVLHVATRSHTLGSLSQTVGSISQTVGSMSKTVASNPQIVGSLPQTLGSLPQYINAPYTFQNIEDEWEEMSPPGGSTYLSSSLAASKGSTTEFRPANSWLPRFEQQKAVPPYRPGLLSTSVSSMFGDGRLPSPTPSEEDEGPGGKEILHLASGSERQQLVERDEQPVLHSLQTLPVSSTLEPLAGRSQQNLEPPFSAGGLDVWKGHLPDVQLLPQNAVSGLVPTSLESALLVGSYVRDLQPGVPSLLKYEQEPYRGEVKIDPTSIKALDATTGGIRKQDSVDMPTWEATNPKRQKLGNVSNSSVVGQGVPGVASGGGWLEDGMVKDIQTDSGPIDMEVDEETPEYTAARLKQEEQDSTRDSCQEVPPGLAAAQGSLILTSPVSREDRSVLSADPCTMEGNIHDFEEHNLPKLPLVADDGGSESHQGKSGSCGLIPSERGAAVGVEMPAVEVSLPKALDGQTEKGLKSSSAVGRKNRASNLWGSTKSHPDLEQLLEGLDDAERFAVQQERERRMAEQERMLGAKKLCLVLDLDHTLLNSAKFTEIEPEWEHRLRATEAAERSRAGHGGRRELYRFAHMGMWTKLRPGIWRFLARASELYELHVYTMGNRVYATEMAKLLDPTGELFAGRVISKGDDADVVDGDDKPPKSKDLDGVMGMESAVVILDDSVRVWPHHSQNLIVVERYMYFPCSRRQFGLSGPSLLEVGHDERETDGMLASALAVVDNIHTSFFSHHELQNVDVRSILAAEQRKVLGGCRIVFSRVFPVGELQPQSHPLWRIAEQFGAVCTVQTDDEVTHVVAISLGTDKVNWAQATGRHVVRPAWIEASTILYRRANERDFVLAG